MEQSREAEVGELKVEEADESCLLFPTLVKHRAFCTLNYKRMSMIWGKQRLSTDLCIFITSETDNKNSCIGLNVCN